MIKSPEELPKETHFAALVFKTHSIHHEGDERSRTHPGHGYPAHTETVHAVEYVAFADKEAMEKWVIKMETSKRTEPKYQLIEARPLSAEMTATVKID